MIRASMDNGPLNVLAHGAGWLVAEKPYGMSVHNAPGNDLCSVLNQYLKGNPTAAKAVGYDAGYGLHPVHRLDKETSGVILLSCRREVFEDCSRQFAQHLVTKRYLAIAHGDVAATDDWGLWQWPLTPKAAGRRNPKGSGKRSACQTQFRLVRHTRHYSLLECRLVTGRTHQIRRHAALAGHPLVGDRRYGSMRACRYLEKHLGFNRLGLQATGLAITLPGDRQPRKFESTRLPSALAKLLDDDASTG